MTQEMSFTLDNYHVYSTTLDLFQDRDYDEKVYSKNQIEKMIKGFRSIDLNSPHSYGGTKMPQGLGDVENRISKFFRSLTPLKKIQREGKYHNPLCEYALGTDCSCWCSEKYHGLKGAECETVDRNRLT